MSSPKVTGYVRTIERADGPVLYTHVRTADDERLQRRLGRAWLKRSAPPDGFLTRSQAEARLASILRGEDADVRVAAPTGVLFREAATEWLRYVEHDRRRELSTVDGYRRVVKYRLLPEFGDLTLDAITVAMAERWRMAMVAEGLSNATVNKLRWKAEAIYKRAMRLWPVEMNPFALVDRQPQGPPADFAVLSPEEVLLLAAHGANGQDAALFIVAAFTGLRLGELRALRLSDLDFASRLVYVRRSFTRGQFKTPKSGRVRSVPMVDQVIPPLDRLTQRERFTSPDDLVFVNDTGNVIEESALRRRFYRALDAAGLKRVRFHDLRHPYCSLAVRGYRLDEVKAYAGHADIATTMRYVHHVPAHDAADRLSKVIDASVHPTVHRTPDTEANGAHLSASHGTA